MKRIVALAAVLGLAVAGNVTVAQSTDGASAEAEATEAVATDVDAGETEGVLTQAELEKLMAPVALYPDTLLIQVLVAATYPLDVVKADQLVQDYSNRPQDELEAAVADKGWDDSVAVLATAFIITGFSAASTRKLGSSNRPCTGTSTFT